MEVKKLKRVYDKKFVPSQEYLNSMPDLQNGEVNEKMSNIDKIGISNFHLPLKIRTRDKGIQEVEVSIVGTVSLEGVKKGINMSRIIRTFYKFKDNIFDIFELNNILKAYQTDLGSYDAHIMATFRYRLWQESLRSRDKNGEKNGGWQYYNVCFETSIDTNGKIQNLVHLDFVYSSTCPCSVELSLHAMEARDQYATPHSQRSIMRVSVEMGTEIVWIEDLVELCRKTLKTETLVFCKREDEQAFAELNAANVKFVEDAVRMVHKGLMEFQMQRIINDFKVIASHNESLHSHDAIAVITAGVPGGFDASVSVAELKSLIY